ncbi:MAG: tetratricopeptide repeat protein, partial [Magnetococcales bacterium]|nr:tetratricopeptide repeat protein [Magnetococcales bacterium]
EFKAESKPEPKPEFKAESNKPQASEGMGRSDLATTTGGPVPTRAEFEAEYPPLSPPSRQDPGVKGVGVVEESMAGDRVMGARRIASLQPSVVGVQTAKDVLPEPSAWSESEFRSQRQAELKTPGTPPAEPKAFPPAPNGADSKGSTEKPRGPTASGDANRRDSSKAAADQAGWVERTYQQALEKKDAGDREGEEALLQQVIKSDPGHKGAVRRMARIMVETNRGDKALEMLRQAAGGRGDTSLADEDPNLAAFLAALYQRREEHWQAIDLYEALLKKYPNKGLWQMGMAISLEKVEENNEAMRAYKKALASGDLNHKLQSFVRKRIEKL